jgi:large subunit ribosomal protein L18
MLTQTSKNANRRHVHKRIRKKVVGTSERPRLNVYRSLNHIYVQLIDDLKGETLVSANSAEGKKGERRAGGNLAAAKNVGKEYCRARQGQRHRESGVRPWRLHLSRTSKGLADAAREADCSSNSLRSANGETRV